MGLPPHVWLLNLVTNFVRSVIASLAYILGYAEATLRARMAAATTYTEWKSAARAIDNARGFLEWRASSDNRVYNHSEAARRIATLRNHMANGDVEMLVDDLQYDFHRAMCGLNNPLLFTQFPSGTKTNARELVSTIAKACKMIADDTNVAVDRKRNMLRHISQAFGRSALVLDSSAAFGAYTVGVVKALHDVGALPYIIFGSGSGALVAAFACCDKNLSRLFNMEAIDFTAFQKRGQKGSATRKIKRLWNEGALMDISVLLQFAKDNIGELTFKEAFERTGRILNIAVSVYNADQRTRSIWLLNYLTAPDILIYTAACASCHAPLVYPRCDILQRMIDGSIVKCEPATLRWSCRMASLHVNDVIGRMRSLFGVNNFIVAEATLMRLPFLSFSRKHFVTGLLAFFSEELWRFLAAVSRIGFLQSRLTGVLQTACVPVTGDVVLHPVSTVGDMLRLISNPDQALLDYCIWRGEQKVWPHLERIRMCLTVENALREAEEKLARCCTGPPAVSPAAGFLGY